MRSPLRKPRSLSLDPDVLSEVERTKGAESVSERVNRLLKAALEQERVIELDLEIAEFFGTAPQLQEERRAFQTASIKTWTRE